jgi:hypothetical protein
MSSQSPCGMIDAHLAPFLMEKQELRAENAEGLVINVY